MTYGFSPEEIIDLCSEEAAGLNPECALDREEIRWRIDARLAPHTTASLRRVQQDISGGRKFRHGVHVRRAIADAWISAALGLDIVTA